MGSDQCKAYISLALDVMLLYKHPVLTFGRNDVLPLVNCTAVPARGNIQLHTCAITHHHVSGPFMS